MISATDVCKNYRQGDQTIEVLKNLSLQVGKGETLAILGESGSGKSTLLSILSGLAKSSSGQVVVDGQSLEQFDEASSAKFRGQSIGVVFQQYHLLPHMTALENVMLPLEIIGQHKGSLESATQALTDVGLGHRLDHFPHQLSGGECQRVAIARALIAKPKVLLADEPSGNLDAKTGDSVMGLLFDLVKRRQTSTILVTHNPELAKLCQKQVLLEDGQLRPAELHSDSGV